MKRLIPALALLAPFTGAAPAGAALLPYCTAERLYVVYEASEGFLLHGGAADKQSVVTSIRCTIVRFGTDLVASSSASCLGPACATADVVGTPYGGMSVCMTATYSYLSGQQVTVGPTCSRIPAPQG